MGRTTERGSTMEVLEHIRLSDDEVNEVMSLGTLLDLITDPIGGVGTTVEEQAAILSVFTKARAKGAYLNRDEVMILLASLGILAFTLQDEADNYPADGVMTDYPALRQGHADLVKRVLKVLTNGYREAIS